MVSNSLLIILCVYLFRMSAAIATGVMPFSSVFSNMVLFSMSQAWQLGRAVQRAVNTHTSVISAIVEQQQGLVLITGKVGHSQRVLEGCTVEPPNKGHVGTIL